jgi:pectate lyase-like protein
MPISFDQQIRHRTGAPSTVDFASAVGSPIVHDFSVGGFHYGMNSGNNVYPLNPVLIPQMFGAKGDGVTDDTIAIQTAINLLTTSGGCIYFPDGTYKLTSAITIPASAGWHIRGQSRLGTIVKQATNNTAIFKFTSDNTHSWSVSDMSFDYSSAQGSGNTVACPFYFVGSGTAFNYFNWSAERLNFSNCNSCFGGDATTKFLVWGYTIRHCSTQGTVSKSFLTCVSAASSGQPNGKFNSIYILATTMTGPVFDMQACSNTQMENIEINTANQSPKLITDVGGGTYDIGSFKLEGGAFTATNAMFLFSNDQVSIRRLLIGTLTIDAGTGGNPFFIQSSAGASTFVHIDFFQTDATISGGTYYVFGGFGGLTDSGQAEIVDIVGSLPANCLLTNLAGSTTAEGVRVLSWDSPRMSADAGNANFTYTEGNPNIILYNTAITAGRTVTLPATTGTNIYNGLKVRIVRTAAATGAFNVDFGGLKNIAVGQFAEAVYHRTAWILSDFGSL